MITHTTEKSNTAIIRTIKLNKSFFFFLIINDETGNKSKITLSVPIHLLLVYVMDQFL